MDSLLTVVTPGSSFDLTTTAHVKADLGITESTDDTIIGRYVTESSIALAAACNRVFASEVLSQQFRDVSRTALQLTRFPVTAIASITEDGTALTASEYEADMAAGLVYRLEDDTRVGWSALKVVVAYTAGYSLPTSAPSDLQRAARALAKSQYLAKGRDPLVRSESVPGVIETAYWVGDLPGGSDWPAEVSAVIDHYRMIRI